ncbi:MAG: class I SAM-dependent methyltransferase [Candidatus Acidiferrales bacterium]
MVKVKSAKGMIEGRTTDRWRASENKEAMGLTMPDVQESEITICPACERPSPMKYLSAPDRYHGRRKIYDLVRCRSCSLVWLRNAPTPTEMGAHYGPDYDRSVAAAGEEPNRWQGRWNVLSQYKTGGAILDLGCSSGGFLAGLTRSSWRLHGIEMSEDVAMRAREKSGAEIFVGDILDAPFHRESFDAITCFHVLEHLYQPGEIFKRVSEWLKPGGIFYLMVPNIDSAGCHIFKSYWYALELPRHLSHFSPKSLRTLAELGDLETVSVTTDREVFIEASTRYILDDVLRKIGINRTPLAQARRPGIPFRAVRKGFRMTILPVLNGLASLAGDGESVHAIFRKKKSK